jgi:Protein of unknown function (DUF3892)
MTGYQAIGRRMSPGGTKHEHITELLLQPFPASVQPQWWAKSKVVAQLRAYPRTMWTTDSVGTALIVVVEANPPYVQTIRDGRYTDNLLALPVYPAYAGTR